MTEAEMHVDDPLTELHQQNGQRIVALESQGNFGVKEALMLLRLRLDAIYQFVAPIGSMQRPMVEMLYEEMVNQFLNDYESVVRKQTLMEGVREATFHSPEAADR